MKSNLFLIALLISVLATAALAQEPTWYDRVKGHADTAREWAAERVGQTGNFSTAHLGILVNHTSAFFDRTTQNLVELVQVAQVLRDVSGVVRQASEEILWWAWVAKITFIICLCMLLAGCLARAYGFMRGGLRGIKEK